jgi:hypothetical protein
MLTSETKRLRDCVPVHECMRTPSAEMSGTEPCSSGKAYAFFGAPDCPRAMTEMKASAQVSILVIA